MALVNQQVLACVARALMLSSSCMLLQVCVYAICDLDKRDLRDNNSKEKVKYFASLVVVLHQTQRENQKMWTGQVVSLNKF